MAVLSDYRVFETDEFRGRKERMVRQTGWSLDRKLLDYIYPQLKQEPHFGPNFKRLQGYAPPTWRYQLGDYRIFYIIDETERIVFLLTLDHRKDIYRS